MPSRVCAGLPQFASKVFSMIKHPLYLRMSILRLDDAPCIACLVHQKRFSCHQYVGISPMVVSILIPCCFSRSRGVGYVRVRDWTPWFLFHAHNFSVGKRPMKAGKTASLCVVQSMRPGRSVRACLSFSAREESAGAGEEVA